MAGQTVIKGVAEGRQSGEVHLLRYSDLLTYQEEKAASAPIGKKGEFELRAEVKEPCTGILQIGPLRGYLLLEPGKSYDLSFPWPGDTTGRVGERIVGSRNVVDLTFRNASPDDLNALISKFNLAHDEFMEKNYQFFLKMSARKKVDTFRLQQESAMAAEQNAYFKDYVLSSIGVMELLTHGRKYVYQHYLKDQPVRYGNEAWMDLFHQFFRESFYTLSLWKNGKDIQNLVNVQHDYHGLMELLKTEDYLEQEQLRELFLLKGFYENYDNPEFRKSSIMAVLQQLEKEGKYEENKAIARTLIERFSRLHVGSPAPDFMMTDLSGKKVRLSDYKGKYVYLDFWATWCTPCLKEMKLMPELAEKFGEYVHFLSISIDADMERMKKLLEKKGYADQPNKSWTFLYYDNQESVKEDYFVKGIPLYYLVNPEGYIVQSPAYRPSGKIAETFARIAEQNKPKRTIGHK